MLEHLGNQISHTHRLLFLLMVLCRLYEMLLRSADLRSVPELIALCINLSHSPRVAEVSKRGTEEVPEVYVIVFQQGKRGLIGQG
jgi:hypothetical protein